MNLPSWIPAPTVTAVVDIVIVTSLIYGVLILFKHTRRSATVLSGILILAALYLVAYHFRLSLTRNLLQYLFAVIAILVIILFQDELRLLFEKLGRWTLERGALRRLEVSSNLEETVLVPVLSELSRERTGALVVLRGRDILEGDLVGGEPLEGVLSASILKSIFDPSSEGHDGAVVIEEGRIVRFGCHLPLSTNAAVLKRKGTRHAAALGLSERSDALCLIVSEERGTVSAARDGELRVLSGETELRDTIVRFREQIAPGGLASRKGFFRRNAREKILAPTLAFALWFVLVHEQRMVQRTYSIPADFQHLPPHLVVANSDPVIVKFTLSGPKRAFYFIAPDQVKAIPRFQNVSPGEATIRLDEVDFIYPANLTLVSYQKFLSVTLGLREDEKPTP